VLFRMARTLHFEATTQDRAVLNALEVLLAREDAHGDAQDAKLVGAQASETASAEAFRLPLSVALVAWISR
jgi:hypothetical protein